jgi:uncharacterized protein (DUF362 family)
MEPVVSVTKSIGHYEGVRRALRLIEEQVEHDVKDKKRILVKPNFVSTSRQLAATHVDAVKAVLDLLTQNHSGVILIGEGPANSSLTTGLTNFNYLALRDEYDVEFLDLNRDNWVEVEGYNAQLRPLTFRLSKSVVESDYRVSIAIPKTHDFVIATLSIKNMVVGSLVNREKSKIHQGYKGINLNIAAFSRFVMPHLGVIDGFVGMEGRGPVSGDPVELRAAVASLYPVSLDAVTSKIMGFDPFEIGYLHHLHEWKRGVIDLEQITIIGTSVDDVARQFQPHPRYHEMHNWRV